MNNKKEFCKRGHSMSNSQTRKNGKRICLKCKQFYENKRKTKAKLALYSALGSKCIRCGFNDIRALQLDHINGDGKIQRSKVKGWRNSYYLKNMDETRKILQLLCANCNWIKRFENHEHSGRPKIVSVSL